MKLLVVLRQDEAELNALMKADGVEVIHTGEPRWDRVDLRAREGSRRAAELIRRFSWLPKPWGVIGSAWPEDLELWRGRFAKGVGTLWVVPHRTDSESIDVIKGLLCRAGLNPQCTSGDGPPSEESVQRKNVDCVLVDEMGVLLELYAAADWAFVGGGFGVSMHSTIEPAIFGIPIACGPNGAEKFSEINELKSTGQLTVVEDGEGLDEWLSGLAVQRKNSGEALKWKERWISESRLRLGATQRVVEVIESCVNINKGASPK